jgi:RimJ/RimL family protein N-acetyltransferase
MPESFDPVVLERRTRAHADELFLLLADPDIYCFIDEAPPASLDALRERFARAESGESPDGSERWLNWVILTSAGRVAGFVQATIQGGAEANVAYVVGTAFQGRGVAVQAVRKMLEILASDYGVALFTIVADRANTKSLRVAAKLGFCEVSQSTAIKRNVAVSDIMMQRSVDAPS